MVRKEQNKKSHQSHNKTCHPPPSKAPQARKNAAIATSRMSNGLHELTNGRLNLGNFGQGCHGRAHRVDKSGSHALQRRFRLPWQVDACCVKVFLVYILRLLRQIELQLLATPSAVSKVRLHGYLA